jgi:hypothetical protein
MERASKEKDKSSHLCVWNKERWGVEMGAERRRCLEYTNF